MSNDYLIQNIPSMGNKTIMCLEDDVCLAIPRPTIGYWDLAGPEAIIKALNGKLFSKGKICYNKENKEYMSSLKLDYLTLGRDVNLVDHISTCMEYYDNI